MKKFATTLVLCAALFATACGAQASVDQATSAEQSSSTGQSETDNGETSSPADTADNGETSSPAGTADNGETASPAGTADTTREDAAETEDAESQDAEAATETEAEAETVPQDDADSAPLVDTTSAAALLGSDDWCTAATQIENTLDVEEDISILSDPDALEEAYTTAGALMNEAVRIAPPAIAGDVAQMAETFVLFTTVLDDAEWDFLGVDLAAMEAVVSDMEVAGFNIEKYNFEICGIGEDPGDAPLSTSDAFDEPLPSGSPRDLMVESFMSGGFTETEALCLVDKLDFLNPEVVGDAGAMLDAFGECGISLDRLSQLGG